ncbi:hypothetical protein EVG20_g4167 [Dentipellis fragilis]|uniref:Peptidase A1 domain-containing protein n=1 Tax=Dentipellis fragilis TaxID=205917 RepID=A0A4Y9YZ97_9AGAM|nr:hypothetical protein EVG20_g4167 [Dentipellis fragilis]
MNRLTQLALSLLTFGYVQPHDTLIPEQALLVDSTRNATKRIAIVGAGTAGISTLKTLLVDLPEEARRDWEVVLFEQRRDVGGIWLPDPNTPQPPVLPETPLYPRLKTNTPHPTMTIPKFPFRPGTALYPQHQPVYQYHADIVNYWNLSSHLKLNYEVLESKWQGSSIAGEWILQVRDREQDVVQDFAFDHLIIANGHNHYPYEPRLEGRERWEQSGVNRTVFHSIFYRNPEDYRGKNIVVVGGGASGRDVAQQVVGVANSVRRQLYLPVELGLTSFQTYVSLKALNYTNLPFPDIPGAEFKPRIQHFTERAVIFEDNSTLEHIDTVILGTGYENRIPFLTAGGHLNVIPGQSVPLPQEPESTHLSTNLRYIRPVYQHVLSLDTSYPLGALYFIGLPIFVANAISDTAQALFVAHTLADPSLLESRDTLLADLHAQEARLRAAGLDPAYIGHRLVGDTGAAQYQDGLVAYLQARGRGGWPNIPVPGQRFTDEWRTFGRNETLFLRKAWMRVEEYGQESMDKWLDGVETEEEWADLMVRLVKWEERKEEGDGSFVAVGLWGRASDSSSTAATRIGHPPNPRRLHLHPASLEPIFDDTGCTAQGCAGATGSIAFNAWYKRAGRTHIQPKAGPSHLLYLSFNVFTVFIMQHSMTFKALLTSLFVVVSVTFDVNAAPTGRDIDLGTLLARNLTARATAPIGIPLIPILDSDGTEEGYVASIGIGGNTRPFNVLMDTGSQDLWVISESSREIGGRNAIGPTSSRATFRQQRGTFGLDFDDGTDVEGTVATDNVRIGSQTLPNFKFGTALKLGDSLDTHTDGMWGFAKSTGSSVGGPTPVEALAAARIIPAAISSWKIGRVSERTASEVVLGGVNPTLFDPRVSVTLPNLHRTAADADEGWWNVQVQGLAVGGVIVPLPGGSRIATIDSGSDNMLFPRADILLIRKQIPGSQLLTDGGFVIPCNFNKAFQIRIGNLPWTINPKDLKTTTFAGNPSLCHASFEVGPDAEWTLGIPFLKNIYLTLDAGNDRVTISKLAS